MIGKLTEGNITRALIKFSIPMILGNLLQQLYNVADTFIVGHYIGLMLWQQLAHLLRL